MPSSALPPWRHVVGRKSRCCALTFVIVWMIGIGVNFLVHTWAVFSSLDNPPTTSTTIDGNENNTGTEFSKWGLLPSGLWLQFDKKLSADPAFCADTTNSRIKPDDKIGKPGQAIPYTSTGELSGAVFNTSMYYPDFNQYKASPFPVGKTKQIPAFCVTVGLERDQTVTAQFGTIDDSGEYIYQGVFTIDTRYFVSQAINLDKVYVPKKNDVYWGFPWDKHEHTVPKFTATVSNRILYTAKAYGGIVEIWYVITSPTVSHVVPVSVYSRITTAYGSMGGWLTWCFFVFALIFVKMGPDAIVGDQLTTRFWGKRPEAVEVPLTSP